MDCGIDGLTFKRPSLVKPQFADECDLKGIVKRFLKTGQLPAVNSRPTISSDENLPDSFQALMDATTSVRQQFDVLPLEVRNLYNNDPEAWLNAQETPKETPKETPVETQTETPKETQKE